MPLSSNKCSNFLILFLRYLYKTYKIVNQHGNQNHALSPVRVEFRLRNGSFYKQQKTVAMTVLKIPSRQNLATKIYLALLVSYYIGTFY